MLAFKLPALEFDFRPTRLPRPDEIGLLVVKSSNLFDFYSVFAKCLLACFSKLDDFEG